MAYGRLEVYFPDGRFETYMLDEDTVSVGRADGNVIALDTDTISRYHFSIVREGNQVSITDLESANGTYVDGMQLQRNQPRVLGDVEEILIGSLRIIFRQVDDAPTIMMHPLDEETQQVEVSASELRVEVDYQTLRVWPAASSSAELAITNLGTQTNHYTIQVTGIPTNWLRITRSEIELDPHETAYILVNVKPPRRSSTTPQSYEMMIEVQPTNQPEQTVYRALQVEINAYSGFGMALGQQAYEDEPVPIFLHNQGSGVIRISLSAKSPNNDLTFQLPSTPLELKAGQHMRVELHLDAQSAPLIGQSKTYPFIVQVQSHDASRFVAAAEGKATISPRIPVWGALAAAGITLSILIVGLLAVLGILTPSEPEIDALTVSEGRVLQGDDLTLFIEAQNTDRFDVLINQVAFEQDVDGTQDTYLIDTSTLSGDIEITVIARNGEATARESISVFVEVPLTVNRFEVLPATLVRNTVNTLEITWDVTSAVSVRIEGLSTFTNNLIQSSTEYDAVDNLTGIGGIPTEALELTLYAQDARGNTLEERLAVTIIDPQCIALESIGLREGPDERYQQVGTIPASTTVVVLAQDADAGWLRVQLPDNIRGWGLRDAFDCAETFDLINLRTEVNVPDLPTATLPPTASPTATATSGAEIDITPTQP
ncbi:MAG: FHA domain-containing protein [Anaerolineae bacterium]